MVSGRYESPHRRRQAIETERRIIDACRVLLLTDGWLGTTMTAIAAQAHVSPTLLYKKYGTKAALAKRVYDVTLVGDVEPAPLSERPEIQAIIDDPDPRSKIARYIHLGRTIMERLGPLSERLASGAAAGDSELQVLVATTDEERLTGVRAFVRHLADIGSLRKDLDPERAADILWALNGPEVWTVLTAKRGWSADDMQQWLTETLCDALLEG